MENNYAINELEQYWGQCVPIGDWKNISSDMPLMTSFVHNFYNAKASQNNKLAFYNGILESFGDPGKESQIVTNRFSGVGPLNATVIKELTNDTINIRNNNSAAFTHEELRKEFVTAIAMVSGQQMTGAPASEREIAGSVPNAQGIVQILSNMTGLDMLKNVNSNLVHDLLPNLLPMAATIKQINPTYYDMFRKMLSVIEGYGTLISILTNLHSGAKAVQPASIQATTPGVGVGINVAAVPTPQAPTLQTVMADINVIADTMKPFGTQVPYRIKQVLERASQEDIADIKNIILNTQVPMKNPNKLALAVSTAFATTQSNDLFVSAPRNIGIAMLYISKVWADIVTKSDAQTGDVCEGFKNLTDLPMTVTNGYRYGLAQAIGYDMSVGNYTATDSLGKLMMVPEISNFAKVCLSKISSSVPQLTHMALTEFMKSRGSLNAKISMNDVDAYLQTIHYPSNGNEGLRQAILEAILDALNI